MSGTSTNRSSPHVEVPDRCSRRDLRSRRNRVESVLLSVRDARCSTDEFICVSVTGLVSSTLLQASSSSPARHSRQFEPNRVKTRLEPRRVNFGLQDLHMSRVRQSSRRVTSVGLQVHRKRTRFFMIASTT
jgi:hypothetical protein